MGIMKKIYLFGVLLGLFFSFSNTIAAQGFIPSETYQQITIDSYTTSGLYLQTDIESHKPRGGIFITTSNYSSNHRLSQHSSYNTPQARVNQGRISVNVWKGHVNSVGSMSPTMTVTMRHLGAGGLPGNPVYVPVGDLPVGLLLLLLLYAFVRWYKRHNEDSEYLIKS